MPDWRARLERELAGLNVPAERMNELVEELAQDLEQRTRGAVLGGAGERDAEARAWAELGSSQELRARLQALEAWSAYDRRARETPPGRPGRRSLLTGLGQDLHHAARALRRSPGFAGAGLLTLALGIGANTTIFTVANALFFTPLPAGDPERVVAVYTSDHSGPRYGYSSYPDFEDLRDQPGLFESLAAYTFEAVALRTDRAPARVWAELVSGEYFPTLGLPMALGRPLGPADDTEGADPAVVVSHGLWLRRLAGDPAVLGRSLTLSGVACTVVGVAPRGFTGLTRGVAAEAWLPVAMRSRLVGGADVARERGIRFVRVVGRLQRGVAIEDAQARLDVLADRLRAAYPDQWTDRAGRTRKLTLLSEAQVRVHPTLFGRLARFSALLAAVVAVVLLIACANVAGLMLARLSARRREVAVRLALGASRLRLVRLFLAESVLLAVLGGALGVALASWASRALQAVSLPTPVPIHLELVVDLRVLAFALVLTLATGLLLGLAPALHAANPELVPALKDEDAGAVSAPRARRLRRAFVAAQVALSMVLLVGAGLLLRGLSRATRLSPGFSVDEPQLVPVDFGLAGYDMARTTALIDGLAQRGPLLPGVDATALTVNLPLELHLARRETGVEGHVPQPGEDREYYFGVVGPGHFQVFGIPILRGREFTPGDREDSRLVAIVNQSFAERFWPGQDPIGRTIQIRGDDLQVVGLARDSKYRTLAEEPMPFYYLPIAQDYSFVTRYARLFPLHVVVRGAGDPAALGRAATAVLEELDPELPVYPPKSMVEQLGASVLPARVASALFAAFGALGLLLASLGLYGVVSYSMTRRTREIGVRIAMGASRRDVLGLGVRDGLGLAAAGVALGALLAVGLGLGLRSLLYGLSPLDPVTFVLVPLLLVAVTLAASILPARRAARVDPLEALRHE